MHRLVIFGMCALHAPLVQFGLRGKLCLLSGGLWLALRRLRFGLALGGRLRWSIAHAAMMLRQVDFVHSEGAQVVEDDRLVNTECPGLGRQVTLVWRQSGKSGVTHNRVNVITTDADVVR